MELLYFSGFIIIVLAYFTYVKLIRLRNQVSEALSGIDIQMQKRFDLIPNILRISKKFMDHERNLLVELTELRTAVNKEYDKSNTLDVSQHIEAVRSLDEKLGKLMISVEDYPELRSDEAIVESIKTYHDVESHIGASRRFYNSAVSDLNDVVQVFPASVVAKMLGIESMALFESTAQARNAINVNDFL